MTKFVGSGGKQIANLYPTVISRLLATVQAVVSIEVANIALRRKSYSYALPEGPRLNEV